MRISENRIATSTPRGDYRQFGSPIQNQHLYKSKKLNDQLYPSTYIASNLSSNSNLNQDLAKSSNQINSIDITATTSNTTNNNYDTSMDRSSEQLFKPSRNIDSSFSLSFSNNSNLNEKTESNKQLCNNQIDQNLNFNLLNTNESITTNYTSIEKLPILKPQSKDYILCFDTSSIDQSASILSSNNEEEKSLKDKLGSDLNNEMKFLNSSISSASVSGVGSETGQSKLCEINEVLSTHLKIVDYPDSGVDTARTLSPHVFNQNDQYQKS